MSKHPSEVEVTAITMFRELLRCYSGKRPSRFHPAARDVRNEWDSLCAGTGFGYTLSWEDRKAICRMLSRWHVKQIRSTFAKELGELMDIRKELATSNCSIHSLHKVDAVISFVEKFIEKEVP
jgi:hypothetical protein